MCSRFPSTWLILADLYGHVNETEFHKMWQQFLSIGTKCTTLIWLIHQINYLEQ